MIWFLLGVIPILGMLLWMFKEDFSSTVIALLVTAVLLGCVFSAVYGAYQMGWIMQCGGDTFWTAEDC